MKLTDDEIVTFGAMMFAGGLNYADGKGTDELRRVTREKWLKAMATAKAEFPKFKSEMKKRGSN